jgi:hypothetical protein
MNKIDKRDYLVSGYGISDERKAIAEKIIELLNNPYLQDINVQDFQVDIYMNRDPFGDTLGNYVIDIQIKGLDKPLKMVGD